MTRWRIYLVSPCGFRHPLPGNFWLRSSAALAAVAARPPRGWTAEVVRSRP